MAVYKVPQDVEADDKLIGPFSFRQFIYLVIVALAMFLVWGLVQLFPPLAIIPLPIIVFFGALALPLRKDQPMEIYMAAMVSFYLKPHRRLWDPDGIDSLIEITVPKTVESQLSKGISKAEAARRLGYLAQIVDTQGWAVRGPGVQAPDSPLNSDVYFEAQQVEDVLDNDNFVAQSFINKLDKSDAKRHDQMIDMMKHPVATLAATMASPSNYFSNTPLAEPVAAPETKADEKALKFNPYPDIHQAVLQPKDKAKQAAKTAPVTSEKVASPGIINLASNTDLSIEAIAREANRIKAKQDSDGGVYISLR